MGLTVLDSGVVIAILDGHDGHHAAALSAVAAALERHDDIVLPVSAYAEAHVTPSRNGPQAIETFDGFIDGLPARVEPASRAIGASAAELRARFGPSLKLPDALVVATAHVLMADRIVTTDQGWPDVGIPIDVVAGRR
ncbi:MAG: PIN domain-containing protein [Candidatus Limnocylindrales bacterium]|nr:PIN domain-containing protein [Candidatus Limnocylindrales bacterium]